jgi:hypothetical protein
VLGSSKSQVGGYGIRAKGEEEAPIEKIDFSRRSQEGGVTLLGGCNFWGKGKDGGEVMREREWDDGRR